MSRWIEPVRHEEESDEEFRDRVAEYRFRELRDAARPGFLDGIIFGTGLILPAALFVLLYYIAILPFVGMFVQAMHGR